MIILCFKVFFVLLLLVKNAERVMRPNSLLSRVIFNREATYLASKGSGNFFRSLVIVSRSYLCKFIKNKNKHPWKLYFPVLSNFSFLPHPWKSSRNIYYTLGSSILLKKNIYFINPKINRVGKRFHSFVFVFLALFGA